MHSLELDPLELADVLQALTSYRKSASPADRTRLDGLIIKLRCQNPVTLARLEVFELVRYLGRALYCDNVRRKLWAMLA